MPHYADGTEAKVGDQVIGELYNTKGVKSGVIVSITPGHDVCNAMVQFTEVVVLGAEKLRMEMFDQEGRYTRRPIKTLHHGSQGPEAEVATCIDYCEVRKLTKVD